MGVRDCLSLQRGVANLGCPEFMKNAHPQRRRPFTASRRPDERQPPAPGHPAAFEGSWGYSMYAPTRKTAVPCISAPRRAAAVSARSPGSGSSASSMPPTERTTIFCAYFNVYSPAHHAAAPRESAAPCLATDLLPKACASVIKAPGALGDLCMCNPCDARLAPGKAVASKYQRATPFRILAGPLAGTPG